MIMRQKRSSIIVLLCLVFGVSANAEASEADFRVTLLGTGAPIPYPDRAGPSTLVEAGNQKLLFDAGRGVPVRMRQINVPLAKIDAVFLTHYHSDHTSGIPDLWLSGWLPGAWARRTTPFHLIGPVGAKSLMANLEKAYALDIKIRLEDEKLPPAGIATIVDEFEQDGVIYEKDGVRVIAFTVDHGPAIKPAVGYRIEYNGHSAVISGDTRYNQNVIKFGTDSDVLIHEVCIAPSELLENLFVQRVIAHHTSPREAGQVFAQAKPKMAAYTHLVLIASDKIPPPTIENIFAETRQTYSGPLEVGEDLMSFEIGETVTVRRHKP